MEAVSRTPGASYNWHLAANSARDPDLPTKHHSVIFSKSCTCHFSLFSFLSGSNRTIRLAALVHAGGGGVGGWESPSHVISHS